MAVPRAGATTLAVIGLFLISTLIGGTASSAAAGSSPQSSLLPGEGSSSSANLTASNQLAQAQQSLESGEGPGAGGAGAWSCQSGTDVIATSCSNAPTTTSIGSNAIPRPNYKWESPVGPQARAAAAMTYDSIDREVVLFGGVDDSSDHLNDTWVYNSSGWHQLFLSESPPPAYLAPMAYDEHDGYVLLLDGSGTWSFVHDKWTQDAPLQTPTEGWGSNLAYDAHDGYMVLFGGFSNATWSYVDGQWTNISKTVAPPARGEAQMVYDPTDGYVLLYGGCTAADCQDYGQVLDDTWAFSSGVWTQLHPSTSPYSRIGGTMMASITFDSELNEVIMFGAGFYGINQILSYANGNQTWAFAHGEWTELNPKVSPPPRYLASMTYDPLAGSVLLLDGCFAQTVGYADALDCPGYLGVGGTFPGNALQDQWSLQGGSWVETSPVQPGYTYSASMTYDPRGGYVLFYAGPGETWEYGHNRWSQLTSSISPPPDAFMSMTYDAKDGYVLLFGGDVLNCSSGTCEVGPSISDQTWKFEDGKWSQLHPTLSPTARAGAAMVYDAADGYTVLFGGSNTTQTFRDTWQFSGGRWTPLAPTVSPPARSTASIAYDATDGYVVLFGGCVGISCNLNGGTLLSDTWTYAHGEWSPVTSKLTPPARSEAGMAYDGPGVLHGSPLGGVLLFGGAGGSGFGVVLGDSWFFLHGQWYPLNVEFPPPARSGEALAYDAADGRILMAGGQSAMSGNTDGNQQVNLNDTWQFVVWA
jgi:hypothetical protein